MVQGLWYWGAVGWAPGWCLASDTQSLRGSTGRCSECANDDHLYPGNGHIWPPDKTDLQTHLL